MYHQHPGCLWAVWWYIPENGYQTFHVFFLNWSYFQGKYMKSLFIFPFSGNAYQRLKYILMRAVPLRQQKGGRFERVVSENGRRSLRGA